MYTQLKQEVKGKKKVKTYQSVGEKTTAFRQALEWSISKQMARNPERFHKGVLKDKQYPVKFAEHMIQKMGSSSVVVINDTVAGAMSKLGLRQDLYTAYQFLGLKPPVVQVKRKLSMTPAAKRARKARRALKELGGKPEYTSDEQRFRGC